MEFKGCTRRRASEPRGGVQWSATFNQFAEEAVMAEAKVEAMAEQWGTDCGAEVVN